MVRNTQKLLLTINRMITTLSMLIVGISSISLVIGGIGIMNMMLVSVTERTAEIGPRKALGAEPKRIQQQFLFEAIFLSLIGVATGILAAYAICSFVDTCFLLSPLTVFLALGFSTTIGIVFGIASARKASKLNPIDALRSV